MLNAILSDLFFLNEFPIYEWRCDLWSDPVPSRKIGNFYTDSGHFQNCKKDLSRYCVVLENNLFLIYLSLSLLIIPQHGQENVSRDDLSAYQRDP